MDQPTSHNPPNVSTALMPGNQGMRPLFPLGHVVATPAVFEHFVEHGIDPEAYVRRHQGGDWGDVPPEDVRENTFSVQNGFRVLSAYEVGGKRFWIITEADRSVTTLLFPCEY